MKQKVHFHCELDAPLHRIKRALLRHLVDPSVGQAGWAEPEEEDAAGDGGLEPEVGHCGAEVQRPVQTVLHRRCERRRQLKTRIPDPINGGGR